MLRTSKFFAPPLVVSRNTFKFLLVACTFTFLISSCQKDEIKSSEISYQDPKYDRYFEIVSFVETMEGKTPSHPFIMPRSGYTSSQLVMFVEGAMNLQFADPNLTWQSFENKYVYFSVPVSSGIISASNVEELYEKVIDSASVNFYNISEPDRFPFAYDLSIVSQSSTTLLLSLQSQIGKVHRDPTPFGSTDHWSVFPEQGRCGPYSGGSINASDRMNAALIDYFTPYGCVFYTDVTQVNLSTMQGYGWWDINESDITPGDDILDYKTFNTYCEDGSIECDEHFENGVYCLDPDEMNYYFQSIVSMYNAYSDYTDLDLQSSGLSFDTGTGFYVHYFWDVDNLFGVRNDCFESGSYPWALPLCCP